MNEPTATPENQTPQTINGPITIEAQLEGGGSESVEVKPLRVSQFPRAFELYDKEDEAGLVELSAGRHPKWCDRVTVESYNALVGAFYQVNGSGFFAYVARRNTKRASAGLLAARMQGALGGESSSPNSGRGRG